jgi:hypothetical protein
MGKGVGMGFFKSLERRLIRPAGRAVKEALKKAAEAAIKREIEKAMKASGESGK